MNRHFRGAAWLVVATGAILVLTIGAVLAHEGRPIDDYRLVVGWLEEPAYEGSQNAVSVRVNKIVEGEEGAEGEAEEGEHGPPGHHGEEPESTPAMSHEEEESSESEDHHGAEESDSDQGSSHHGTEDSDSDQSSGHDDPTPAPLMTGDPQHEGDGQSMVSGMSGEEDEHHGGTTEAENAMSVSVQVLADSVSGVNVRIAPQGFTFAPGNVNGTHVDGEGHAHIYVDGVKISRVYTPWYYLGDVEPGDHEIRVTLNANSHNEYTFNGEKVEATTHFTVTEPHGHSHAPETRAAENQMSVNISLEPDFLGGANLFVETDGFTFAPQNVGKAHSAAEGYGHVYVNGVKIGRIYGEAMQLGNLAVGENEVRVSLYTNDHSSYTWSGNAVEATTTIDTEPEMGGAGYGNPPSASHEMGEESDGDAKIDSDHNHHGMTYEGEDSDMAEQDENGDETDHQSSGHSSMLPQQGAGKPLASIAGQDEGVSIPVEGLEGSLQVEVTHVATGTSRTLDLEAAWGDPGHYVVGLIPTASGVYEFRVFGTIEGTAIDETFVSQGGGGDFDDIQSSAALQFPEHLPEMREIVGAVQGARDIAQQAQDTALAVQTGGTTADGGGSNVLAIVALIIGIAGVVLGTGGVYLAVRARQAQ